MPAISTAAAQERCDMRSGNFTYALLGLVSGKPHGIHGYRLLSEVEALADDFWQLNYGSLYRALDWLARRSDLEIHEDASGLRPPRKVYKITPSGEAALASWLVQPIPDKPRVDRRQRDRTRPGDIRRRERRGAVLDSCYREAA
jgi:DNA-binding PadR family transcriptional regulator